MSGKNRNLPSGTHARSHRPVCPVGRAQEPDEADLLALAQVAGLVGDRTLAALERSRPLQARDQSACDIPLTGASGGTVNASCAGACVAILSAQKVIEAAP